MKVLLIDVNCKHGSTGKIVYDLYSKMNSIDGYEPFVAYGRGKKIDEKNIFKFGIDLETVNHALLTRITGYTGCFSFFSTKKLISYIKKIKPDIIHIHELHAYFINIGMLLKFINKENIKVIHTLHCEFSYTGKCGISYDCLKWRTLCNKCCRKKEYVKTLFYDRTQKMFLKKKNDFSKLSELIITTPSEWLTERAKQSFFSSRRIITINNGVDTNVIKFTKDFSDIYDNYHIPKDKKIVLSIAPNIMSSLKGGNFTIELSSQIDLNDYFFILIGADDNICNDRYIKIKRINNPSILAKFYSIADLFLLTSKRESFSLTCAESLLCGTPVVGFKCGAPEIIYKNEFCYFVEYGDIDKLKKAITFMANKQWNRESIIAFATQKYSNKKMESAYLKLYDEVYNKKY